jgi:hypothetical protein
MVRKEDESEKNQRRVGKAEWDAMEKENEDKSAAQEDDEGVMGATTKASSVKGLETPYTVVC